MEGGLEKHVASSVVPSWVVVKIPTQRYFGSFEALFFPRGDGRWTVDPLFCAPHPWVLDTQCQIRCTPYRFVAGTTPPLAVLEEDPKCPWPNQPQVAARQSPRHCCAPFHIYRWGIVGLGVRPSLVCPPVRPVGAALTCVVCCLSSD